MAERRTVRVPFPEGINAHGKVVTEIVLQEPSYEQYLTLGEPSVWTSAPNGAVFAVQDAEVIKSYISACLVEPKEPLLLEQGGMKLARAVKGAVLSFFRDDVSETEQSKTSPTSSSSNADSQQTQSVA